MDILLGSVKTEFSDWELGLKCPARTQRYPARTILVSLHGILTNFVRYSNVNIMPRSCCSNIFIKTGLFFALAWRNVLVVDLDVVVAVVAHLLVPQANGVHQLVDHDVKLQTRG